MSETAMSPEVEFGSPSDLDERIFSCRRGKRRLCVVGADGPVPEARVRVTLRRHAFNFGGNAFGWGKMGRLGGEDGEKQRHRTVGDDGSVIPNWLAQRVVGHGQDYDDGSHRDDQLYTMLFTEIFNLAVVPLYELAVSPNPWQCRLHRAGVLADWARQNGMSVKGHPLVFHPRRWKKGWWDQMNVESYWDTMRWRQTEILGRFSDTFDWWDFLNEPIAHTPPADSPLDAAVRAYRLSRSLNQKPNLTLNFNQDEALCPSYQPKALQMVEQLLERGMVPDVIGIQSHLGMLNQQHVDQVCAGIDSFAQFGIPLHFTETTFKTPRDMVVDEAEHRQAHDVEAFYRYIFSRPEIDALVWWDLCDRHSFCEIGGLVRTDMTPKPAHQRLRSLIRDQWHTDEYVEVKEGKGMFEGFFGEYEAQVQMPNGSSVFQKFVNTPKNLTPAVLTI